MAEILLLTIAGGAVQRLDRALHVGRAPDNDLVLGGPGVSGHHARIEPREGGVWILDLASKNGTYVNGERVPVSGKRLEAGDHVDVGSMALEVSSQAGPRSVPAPSPESHDPTLPGLPEGFCVASSVETASSLARSPADGTAMDRESAEFLLVLLRRASALESTSEGEPETILHGLLDLALEALPARRGAVYVVKAGTSPIPFAFRDVDARGHATFVVPRAVLAPALIEGRSVLIGGLAAGGPFDPSASMIAGGIQSAACVPILAGPHILGALYLDGTREVVPLGRRELELATVLATQAGIAIENRRLARRAAESEHLATVGLAVGEVAHDLSNYLTRVQYGEALLGEWLEDTAGDRPPDAWSVLKEALASTYRLVRDLKGIAARRDPRWEPTEPETTIAAVLAICAPAAQRQRVIARAEAGTGGRPVAYDPSWIERALVNLVRNAIDASRPESEVTLGARVDGGSLLFTCRDRGSGIPPEAQANLFNPFFTRGKANGSGLGLAIAHRIATAHGGGLTFTTEVGAGTVFTLSIPLERQAKQAA